ncbi:MAG: DUF5018 domain-containing protein, partial [Candidatus Riflebacteria bacterium]|nr:DUF5018 domain-containing protein [Candidatus Riflebacteria bacterium]
NFTSPVTYTVTAADSSTQAYTVTVTVAPNTAKAITAFNFASPAATGIINETAKTVALTVPYGTDVTALVPTITHTGASVSPASGIAQDFTSPVTYTVTAADSTTQAYTVTVVVTPAPVVTAPVAVVQYLKSGDSSTSTVQMNVPGNIYLVKNLEPATSLSEINAAIAANKAFIGVNGAAADTAYTITVAAALLDGVYDIVGVDTYGNVSGIVTGWLNVDNTAPANQNAVLTASVISKGGASLVITSSGDALNTVWLAPSGTINFTTSSMITSAAGTATSINAPATEGVYYLYVIDAAGNVSAASTANVTVDNTAPANQNVVLAASVFVTGGAPVSITSSGDSSNAVWLAPSGTLTFSAGSTMTTAGGTDLSIYAPTDEGTYYLYVVDAAGNVSAASTAGVTVDNTAPAVVLSDDHPDTTVRDADTVTITATFTEADQVDETSVPTITIGGLVSNAGMTKVSNLVWTYIWDVPTGNDGAQSVSISAADRAGNTNTAATGKTSYTIDNIAPADQDSVLEAPAIVKGGTTLTIAQSSDPTNTVWLAPLATTVFVAGSDMTYAAGSATSITVPADEGTYYLYVIDVAGNVSLPSSANVSVDNTAPTIQDTVLTASVVVKGNDPVTIVPNGDIGEDVWLAPIGTLNFSESSFVTTAAGSASSINAPADEGVYHIFVIDDVGNVSAPSTAFVTVDNTAPTNQNTVLATSYIVKGGVSVAITSSGDAGNSVWLAPSGTNAFEAGSTITTAGGTATSIAAPAAEGVYFLYVIDAAGNVSAPSTANVTVDNTIPTNQDLVFSADVIAKGGAAVAISSSGDAGNSVWLAPTGTTNFVADATMTTAGGEATSISAPSTEGVYYLYVIDAAGNVSLPSMYGVTVDNTPPTVVLTDDHPDAIVRNGDSVIITATFTEANQMDEVSGAPTIQIGGMINSVMTKQSNLVWAYTWNVPTGNDGVQAVVITSTDVAGNANTAATGTTSYTIDNIGPTVVLSDDQPDNVVMFGDTV